MKKQFKLAREKGFTLIEFLIALVIIGFIVAILVNFFNNPMSEASLNKAASKITDDTRILSDAFQKRYMDTTTEITTLANLTAVSGTSAAPLTGLPVAPANALNTAANGYYYVTSGDATAGYKAWGDNTLQDGVIVLGDVTTAVCDKINTAAGLGTGGSTPVAPTGTSDLQCFKDATIDATVYHPNDTGATWANDDFVIVKPVFIR